MVVVRKGIYYVMIISSHSLNKILSRLLVNVEFVLMQLPEFRHDCTWDDNQIRCIIASLSQVTLSVRDKFGIKGSYKLCRAISPNQTTRMRFCSFSTRNWDIPMSTGRTWRAIITRRSTRMFCFLLCNGSTAACQWTL